MTAISPHKTGEATSGERGCEKLSISLKNLPINNSFGHVENAKIPPGFKTLANSFTTIICNHIDLKNSNKVKKTFANNLYEDTDLNNKLITVSVENLTETEIRQAISKGKNISEHYISKNLIKSVIINLQDKILILGHKFNIKFNKKIKILEV